jgi:hypothetical protein
VLVDRPSDAKEDRFDCDRVLMEMIAHGHIRPGDKFHCYGLFLFKAGLIGLDKWKEIPSKHYFLNNQDKHHLKVNINGFAKADQSCRLGEQEIPFFRKSLCKLSQYSKQIPCLDVFVIKKYQPYFLEEVPNEEDPKRPPRFIVRSRKAMDRLCTIRKTQLEQHCEKESERLR